MILILHEGRKQLVASLNGYEGATVLAGDVAAPPDGVTVDQLNDDGSVPIELLRSIKWRAVKAIRDAKEAGDAPTPFGAVQCDDRSKLKISGMVQMAQIALANAAPFSEPFTMADNSVVTLSAVQAVQMGVATGQYVSALYATARDLRDAINAAADQAELDAIDITAGWP